MRFCLVFNPAAGAAERVKDFLMCLDTHHRCEVRPTAPDTGADVIAREAAEEGFDRIIVAGGDGTLNAVVQGLAPDFGAVEIGLLPFGTGNDFGRALGLTPQALSEAYLAALGGSPRPVDLIRIDWGEQSGYCVNVANGGLGGRTANDVRIDDKRRWGPLAYWLSSASAVLELPKYDVRLTLDEQRLETTVTGLAVANGRFVGGGFPIAPTALVDDGWMDLVIIPELPLVELIAAGLNLSLGRNDRADCIKQFRARNVVLEAHPQMPFSVDGQPVKPLSARFEVVPRALRIVGLETSRVFTDSLGLPSLLGQASAPERVQPEVQIEETSRP